MRKRLSSAGGRSPNPPASFYYQPQQATLVTHKKLDDMDVQEAILYAEQLAERLRKKQNREKNYLQHRASRGRHTSTDELYEEDQVLENELLAVLAQVVEALKEKAKYYGTGN